MDRDYFQSGEIDFNYIRSAISLDLTRVTRKANRHEEELLLSLSLLFLL